MTSREINNNRLNNHKVKTNELITPIDSIIKHLSHIDPIYSKINNPVETYRDKIFDIYSSLEKQSIDFWSEEFPLGDLIRYHLENKMYHNVEALLLVATEITSKKNIMPLRKKTKMSQITKLNTIDKYIKNYDINTNIYDTLIWYYNNIEVNKFKPKEIIYSYININLCLKKIGLEHSLSQEQERNILEIIEQKENECIEYNKKFNELLELLKKINDQDKTLLNKIKQK